MSVLMIEGGTVYDPMTGSKEQQVLRIENDRIAPLQEDGQRKDGMTASTEQGVQVIRADGCFVVPGLIDYHIHLYSSCDGGVPADVIGLPSGVTTAVDGGTCGTSHFDAFARTDIASSITRIKSYLNVSSGGLATGNYPENVDPAHFEAEKMKELFVRYPDILVALKYRISRNIAEASGHNLLARPLERTVEIAEEIGCPVVVHMNDPIIPVEEAVRILRPGDVFCHMYHGRGDTILGTDGHVKKEIRAARERGLIFDACNGRSNFSFRTALAAMEDGFIPDIISTDISPVTFYKQPVVSMPRLMAKYLAMGLSLEQVIDRVTRNPARQLGMERELGSLQSGTVADVTILKIVERPMRFYDCEGRFIDGQLAVVPQMTIKSGKIVYCQADF